MQDNPNHCAIPGKSDNSFHCQMGVDPHKDYLVIYKKTVNICHKFLRFPRVILASVSSYLMMKCATNWIAHNLWVVPVINTIYASHKFFKTFVLFTGKLSSQPIEDSESFHPWSDTFHEQWVWSSEDKSPSVYLCLNNKVACFYIDPVIESTGTAGVRGTKAFSHGQHYWEVKLSSVFGTSMMIGVGTKEALLQTADFEFVDLIGRDDQSWGLSYKGKVWHNGQYRSYCEPFYDSTVIGVLLDMDAGTLSYFKNGRSLGLAFTGLCNKASELYPIISSTSTLSEIELCDSTCRYVSLQDQCRMTITKLVGKDQIDYLPLPRGICQSLKGI